MAKRSLADLAAAFDQKGSSSTSSGTWKLFFPFWKAPADSTSVIRFLPDLDESNPMGFLVENLTHTLIVNGKRETIACLKMYGEDCPVCALSQKYYDEKDPEHNEALGKKYYRKRSYIGQALIIETPVEHDANQLVKLIEFGPKIFQQIQSAFKDGDLAEAPYELKGGYNFRIKKTQSGQYADYGTSNFSPKQSDISEDVLERIELYDLKQFRAPKLPKQQVEAMLLADQTGANVTSSEEGSSEEDTDTKVSRTAPARAPAPAPAPSPAVADGEKKLSVVEQLRLRKQQREAAGAQ
jgi:hypothetical protein